MNGTPMNGHALRPPTESDWMIAFDAGRTLVGLLRDGPRRLDPAFDFGVNTQMTPQGMAITHVAQPVLMLASFDRWVLSEGAVLAPVADLSPAEREGVMGAVRRAEEMAKTLRLARAGIALAGPGDMPPLRRG